MIIQYIRTGEKFGTLRIETGDKLSGGKTFFSQPADLEIPEKYLL